MNVLEFCHDFSFAFTRLVQNSIYGLEGSNWIIRRIIEWKIDKGLKRKSFTVK